ncbi:MAG: hypothetical protein K9J46_23845, partial [Saprospiraceae bacterium]|nr:hypothetical protein [Saprospiraceae bacterium]
LKAQCFASKLNILLGDGKLAVQRLHFVPCRADLLAHPVLFSIFCHILLCAKISGFMAGFLRAIFDCLAA